MQTTHSAIEQQIHQLRQRVSFNDGWRFIQGDAPEAEDQFSFDQILQAAFPTGNAFRHNPVPPASTPGAELRSAYALPGHDDSAWRQLSLPHDWGIEGPFSQEYPGETGKLPWADIGWYRKAFSLSQEAQGRRFYLDFDGAMSHALVWVNGRFAGGWPYGYASFRIDLTPYLHFGDKNVVAVRLDNPPDSSRWYPGGGIYRNTWLVQTGPVHVTQWGTFVTTPDVTPEAATISIRVNIDNDLAQEAAVEVQTDIFRLDKTGAPVGGKVAATAPESVRLRANSSLVCDASMTVARPAFWSTSEPNRYLAVTTLTRGDEVVDRYETPFGIRTVVFDAKKGFLLNGEILKMNGVCQHHDLGALGSALHPRALERQMELLRDMGVNAIRTSHNPPAPELLDLCDQLGLVIIDEAFDAWSRAKRPNDYARLFPDWHEADLRALIRRDRNHPCVVLWSTGNEINEQVDEEGHAISRRLTAIVKSEDSTRPVTVGCNVPEAAYNGFQSTIDVFGFNYKPWEYGPFRKRFPNIPCYGSETASTISSRGEYFFPVSNDKHRGQANFQISSYDLYTPRWATTPDTEFEAQDRFPFVFGEFVWTGFDYIGEPTPYNTDSSVLLNFSDPEERTRAEEELAALGKLQVPSRSSYFGIIDLAGFKKDRFYLYQSRWRPELPMAHILPHWNWPERVGEITPVHVYTSGDEAELFLNGRPMGRKKKEPFTYRLRWDDLVYEPGELKVVAYRKGKKWAEATRRTTGPAAALCMEADHGKIRADGTDLSFVTLSVLDREGLVVPRSHNPVEFTIAGPGVILATDNGNPTSHESFQSPRRKAWNGLALAIIRAHRQTGPITLHAESPNLLPAELTIEAT